MRAVVIVVACIVLSACASHRTPKVMPCVHPETQITGAPCQFPVVHGDKP